MVRVTRIKSFGTSHEAVYLDRLNWTENATPSFFFLCFFSLFFIISQPASGLAEQQSFRKSRDDTRRDQNVQQSPVNC